MAKEIASICAMLELERSKTAEALEDARAKAEEVAHVYRQVAALEDIVSQGESDIRVSSGFRGLGFGIDGFARRGLVGDVKR